MTAFYWIVIGLLVFVVVSATVVGSWILVVLAGPVLLAFLYARPKEL